MAPNATEELPSEDEELEVVRYLCWCLTGGSYSLGGALFWFSSGPTHMVQITPSFIPFCCLRLMTCGTRTPGMGRGHVRECVFKKVGGWFAWVKVPTPLEVSSLIFVPAPIAGTLHPRGWDEYSTGYEAPQTGSNPKAVMTDARNFKIIHWF